MTRFSLWLRARLSLAPIVVHVEGGRARAIRGEVTSALLGVLAEVAREHGLGELLIEVSSGAAGPQLTFSGDVPAHVQQRMLNLWFAHPDGRRL